MTNRPIHVHSSGMVAVKEMPTALRPRMNARRSVFYLGQVCPTACGDLKPLCCIFWNSF